jgi:hypothetical protein
MRTLSLEDAVAAIQALPPAERAAAAHALADAVAYGLTDTRSPAWTIFDALECTPARAGRCRDGAEMFPVTNEVCSVFVDEDCVCPHALGARLPSEVQGALPLFHDQ